MTKFTAASFLFALALMMLLPVAHQVNTTSVNHSAWTQVGPPPPPGGGGH
jgi:hypothetical protein